MIEDEFKELMNYFSQTAQGKNVNLEEVCKHSMEFFEKLKQTLKKGTPEEKTEALALMNQMYSNLMKETKVICEKTGLSEEQLMAFAENPSNFSPDQWQTIQNAKQKMVRQGEELSELVKTVPPGDRPPGPQLHKQPDPKDKKGPPKSPKDKWVRS